jgi:hypothetical protein
MPQCYQNGMQKDTEFQRDDYLPTLWPSARLAGLFRSALSGRSPRHGSIAREKTEKGGCGRRWRA